MHGECFVVPSISSLAEFQYVHLTMSHPKPSNKLANYPGRVDAPSLNSNNNTFNIFPFFPLRSAKSVWLQGDTSGWGLYFVDINLGSYPGLLGQYIAAVAAHKPGELPNCCQRNIGLNLMCHHVVPLQSCGPTFRRSRNSRSHLPNQFNFHIVNPGPNSIEKNRLKNQLKNRLIFNFDSVTCPNYPFFDFFLVWNLSWFFSQVFSWFFSWIFFYWIRPPLIPKLSPNYPNWVFACRSSRQTP